MRTKMLGLLAIIAFLTGCADATSVAIGGESPGSTRVGAGIDEAPPVVVSHGQSNLSLDAWTTCWTGGSSSYCADGAPPDDPPDLGTITDEVVVEFPVDGWMFTAVLRHPSKTCGLSLPIELDVAGERRWTLPETGPAGAYEVDVSGRGPEGDVHVTFAMHTTRDGAMPPPTAWLSMFYDHDGTPVLYGPPSLGVEMLAVDTPDASGSIAVEAADGQRTVVGLDPAPEQCLSVGSARLSESGAAYDGTEQDAVSRFGTPPYAITVELDLDGSTYAAEASHPTDLDDERSAIQLTFTPALPTATATDYAVFVGR